MPMRTADLDRARALPLFSGASPETFRAVTAGAFLQKFPSGTTLLLEGDPVDFHYVLLEGIVELQGTWNDKETTLAVLRPVSTFILAAVVLDAPALMSARTIERSEILMLSGESLRRAMREDAQFATAAAQELAGCYRGLVRAIKNQKDAFSLFVEHQDLRIMMIHAGWPWVAEASYVGTVLPNIWLDISELVPWGWGQTDWSLEMLLGAVPGAKILHGSDESSEPEMFPLSAWLVRDALERVLGTFVDRDYLSRRDAESIGRGVLAGNVRALHGDLSRG